MDNISIMATLKKEFDKKMTKKIREKSDNWFFYLSPEKRLDIVMSFLKMWILTNQKEDDIQRKDIEKVIDFLKRKEIKQQIAFFIGVCDMRAAPIIKQKINELEIIDFEKHEI